MKRRKPTAKAGQTIGTSGNNSPANPDIAPHFPMPGEDGKRRDKTTQNPSWNSGDPGKAASLTKWKVLVCAVLVLGCLVVYGQTLTHDFVNYDDGLYITANPEVRAGLSWSGLIWALTTNRANYLHTMTWLSLMLDCDLYDLHAWGHHLTSMIFHCVNAVLLFLVLAKMTGRTWPCALAAALWALHPLRMESVAWAASRKDVLSMFFWLLGMWAYAWHRESPSLKRYLAVSLLFLCGLLSKPTVVTFPFTLMLLDYWPLNRIDRSAPLEDMARRGGRVFLEKVPLLLLTVAMSAATYAMQSSGANLAFMSQVPLADRCANAIVVYALYLVKMAWPSGLAAYYPHPIHRPLWEIAAAACILGAITLVVLWQTRRRPWLPVGWFWYLGTLAPVIQLVQQGSFSHADRFTYTAMVGICIMVAFELDNLRLSNRIPGKALTAAATLLVAGYAAAAVHQGTYWKNSETLFRHALDVTADNPLSRNNLGSALYDEKDFKGAEEQYKRAVKLDPGYYLALANLGLLLENQGKWQDAAEKYREAVKSNPDSITCHLQLAGCLSKLGQNEAVEAEYREVVRLDPEKDEYCYLLGTQLLGHKPEEAAKWLEKATRLNPKNGNAWGNLGAALMNLRRPQDAVPALKEAVRLQPKNPTHLVNLGVALLRTGDKEGGRAALEKALALDPGNIAAITNLQNIH